MSDGTKENPNRRILLTNCVIHSQDPIVKQCNNILIEGNTITNIFYSPSGKETVPGSCVRIDCFNNLVVPGINDAHIHLLSSAAVLTQERMHHIPAYDYAKLKDAIATILDHTTQPKWIGAHGLDDRFFFDLNFSAAWLDQITMSDPVFISNETGHAIILNSKAMQLLNINQPDSIVTYGVTDVNENGQLTGKFFDMNSIIFHKINQVTNQFHADHNLPTFFSLLHEKGITSVQDAGHNNQIQKIKRLSAITDLNRLRIGLMIGCNIQNINELAYISNEINTDMVKFIGLKIMLSEATGNYIPSKSELETLINLANSHHFRVAVHAVEEEAIDMTLDAFRSAHNQYPHIINRIEHCSEYSPAIIEKAKTIPFCSVTQPGFILHRGDYYMQSNSNDKLRNLYPLRSMLESSSVLALSSDSPVIPPDPWEGFVSAQSRNTLQGKLLGAPTERLSFNEIINCYTTNGAKVEGQHNNKGTLRTGLLADLAILDTSLIGSSNPVLLTVLDGQIVWNSQALTLTLH